MSSLETSSVGRAAPSIDSPCDIEIAMQAFIQHEGMQHPTFPERLTERLPTLSSQAADVLAKRCRRVIRQAIALALRVKLRILTRREAALALYDRFPGLTRQTSDRIIGRSISRLSQ